MKVYTVGKLRKMVRESAKEETKQEFKPVFGKNVQSDDKKINGKAYQEMKKETDAYNGGIKAPKFSGEAVTPNDNKSMSDLMYDGTNEQFSKDNKSRMKGYVNAQAEKNHKNDPFGNADFGKDEEVTKAKEHANAVKKGKDTASEIGLTGRVSDKKQIEGLRSTMFDKTNESKTIKKLTFKNIKFLTEGHMLSRIPDELKEEGNRFIMRDAASNEYLVEWHHEGANVTKKVNNKELNEMKNHIKDLYNYKHSDYYKNSTSNSRINETKEFSDILNKARSLMK